jgi:chromosome segregation ATPase
MSQLWQALAYISAGLGGGEGLRLLLTARSTSRKQIAEAKAAEQAAEKSDAEARKVISDATLQLMQPLIARAEQLETRLRSTEDELSAARKVANELTRSLQAAQAETANLRSQVDAMSKDLAAQQDEIHRLRNSTEH